MITEARKRITTAATTTVTSTRCLISQVVISCASAGTTFKLKIQDKATPSPFVLIPEFTLIVPTDGMPNVDLLWKDFPVSMDGGIDIITTGTPGEVSVWLALVTN